MRSIRVTVSEFLLLIQLRQHLRTRQRDKESEDANANICRIIMDAREKKKRVLFANV